MQKAIHWLLIIGGLNWLLFGLLQWDIGQVLGGMDSWLARIVYIIIGLAALVSLKPKSSPAPVAPQM